MRNRVSIYTYKALSRKTKQHHNFLSFVFPPGRKKESPHSPGSSALLNELRQILLDCQTSRTNAVNEVRLYNDEEVPEPICTIVFPQWLTMYVGAKQTRTVSDVHLVNLILQSVF